MPSTATASVGMVVEWLNTDLSRSHAMGEQDTVADGGSQFSSVVLVSGASVCLVFSAPGTFNYYDNTNGFMVGTLTITGNAITSSVITTTTTRPTTTIRTLSSTTTTQLSTTGTRTLSQTTTTTSIPTTTTTSFIRSTTTTTAQPTSSSTTTKTASTTTISSTTSSLSPTVTTASSLLSSSETMATTAASTYSSDVTTAGVTSTESIHRTTTLSAATTTSAPTQPPITVNDFITLYFQGLEYQEIMNSQDDFGFCLKAGIVSVINSVIISDITIISIEEGSVIVNLVIQNDALNSTAFDDLEQLIDASTTTSLSFIQTLSFVLNPIYFTNGDSSMLQLNSTNSEALQQLPIVPTPIPVSVGTATSILIIAFVTALFYATAVVLNVKSKMKIKEQANII